jgi:ParB-like chromosome segregation protein Spo0J
MSLDQHVSGSRFGTASVAVEPVAIARLRPYRGNARTHATKQIRQIAASIEKFGFINPVLVSDDNEIIAGTAGWRPPSFLA